MVPHSISERYKEQASAAADLVRPYTTPLFRQRTATVPDFEGSGILLEVDSEHRLLITAAHVLDKLHAGVYLLTDGREEYPLSGSSTATTLPRSGDRNADPFDLGYIRLSSEEVNALGTDNFLPLRWLGVRDALIEKRGLYFVLGFPMGFQKQEYSSRTWWVDQVFYWAPEAKTIMYKHAKCLRESHVLLRYNPHRIVGPKGVGGSPSFRGMSGAGIWRFSALETYRPDNMPRLVAIHLGRAPGVKELVGSRISLLIESLRCEFPQLDAKLPRNPGLRTAIRWE